MTSDTKTRILDTALGLFNDRGSSTVTTNHIAQALGISPGNLYYHFRNKAEILRGLFARIVQDWAVNYALPAATAPSLAASEAMITGNFRIQARYRFFFRDLTLLLNADPALAQTYRQTRTAGIANTNALLDLFAEAGVLKPFADPETRQDLALLLWLVGDFWLVFQDTGGCDFTDADMQQGIRLFRRLLAPHLNKE